MSYYGPWYCMDCRQWSESPVAHIHPMREENKTRAHDQAFEEDARRDVEALLA